MVRGCYNPKCNDVDKSKIIPPRGGTASTYIENGRVMGTENNHIIHNDMFLGDLVDCIPENKKLMDENSLVNGVSLEELANSNLLELRWAYNKKQQAYFVLVDCKLYKVKANAYSKIMSTLKYNRDREFHKLIGECKERADLGGYNCHIKGNFDNYTYRETNTNISKGSIDGEYKGLYSFDISISKVGNRRGSKRLRFCIRFKDNYDWEISGEDELNINIKEYIRSKCIDVMRQY